MLALRKFLNQLSVKGWEIIRRAGRNQALVAMDFLVHPSGTSIAQVCLQGWEGGKRAALEGISVRQDPCTCLLYTSDAADE
mgnify:CR=1 FL=1